MAHRMNAPNTTVSRLLYQLENRFFFIHTPGEVRRWTGGAETLSAGDVVMAAISCPPTEGDG